jgi:lipoprotein-anchoring transpeptidase ErfK/SrfK
MRLRFGILATTLSGMMLGSPVEANSSHAGNKIAEIFNVFSIEAIPPQTVIWRHPEYKKGDVVVSTVHRRLYYVLGGGQAIEYGVGVGRTGFTWSGVKTVTRKREWPDWTPPTAMLKRRPGIPHHMVGGVDNPLGARALYLGSSEYRIHGSNEQDTIGTAVSSGCIRMTNRDVIDLYNRVKVGTKVVVLD